MARDIINGSVKDDKVPKLDPRAVARLEREVVNPYLGNQGTWDEKRAFEQGVAATIKALDIEDATATIQRLDTAKEEAKRDHYRSLVARAKFWRNSMILTSCGAVAGGYGAIWGDQPLKMGLTAGLSAVLAGITGTLWSDQNTAITKYKETL